MKENTFYDGQEILWGISQDGCKVSGIIRGIAVVEQAMIGATYIVEDTSGSLPSELYDYKFVAIPELFIVAK